MADPATIDPDRDEFALTIVQIACDLAVRVRDEGPDAVAAAVAALPPEQRHALPAVMAAMIPDDRSANDLLAWTGTPSPALGKDAAIVRDPHPGRVRRQIPVPGRKTPTAKATGKRKTKAKQPKRKSAEPAVSPPTLTVVDDRDELDTIARQVTAERYRHTREIDPQEQDIRKLVHLLAQMLTNPGPTDAELAAAQAHEDAA